MEKRHLFANKLYIAEMNREKELQKKLDIIRQHVGFLFLLNNFIFLLSVLYLSIQNNQKYVASL